MGTTAPIDTSRPILLVGFMGSGKSSVGARLAALLGREFYDSDEVIVERSGMSIPELFASRGEAAFRRLEADTIAELISQAPAAVVALGGGAFETARTRTLARAHTTVVHLSVSFVELERELDALARGRPLLAEAGAAQVRALYERRAPTYRLAHLTVHTGRRGPDAAAQAVLEALRSAARPGCTVPR